MSAFRAALRISRRDSLRFKGRSALVMVMIALPVFVFTGLLTALETADVSFREGLTARLGAADAQIITHNTANALEQNVSGDSAIYAGQGGSLKTWTPEEIAALAKGRVITYNRGMAEVRVGGIHTTISALEVDLRDPMTRGLRTLTQGRLPAAPGEIAVSPRLLDQGIRLGDTIPVTRQYRPMRVVGVVEHPFEPAKQEIVAAEPGTLLKDGRNGSGTGWLVDSAAPMLWPEVLKLNQAGLSVHSRAVVENPPANLPYDARMPYGDSERQQAVNNIVGAGTAIIVIVLETVLLAGPAFAVSLRRRRRELAVIAAHGASPAHLRTIVLADGLVLGGVAAVAGTTLGLAAGVAGPPFAAGVLELGTAGPIDVPWARVLGIALLGLVSGVVAALVPAVQAARQAPAQVLADRVGAQRGRAGKPVLGLLLVAAGLVAIFFALRSSGTMVLAAAVIVLLGLVALMPWLVHRTTGLAAWLPLPLRLSVRDATRHRVRTASAAAAVMAVTAAMIAMGIAISSSETSSRQNYRSPLPVGGVSLWAASMDDQSWARVRTAAQAKLPGATLVPGFVVTDQKGRPVRLVDSVGVSACAGCVTLRYLMDLAVGDADLLAFLAGRKDPQAEAALAAGKAVVFSPGLVKDGMVTVESIDDDGATPDFRVPAVETRSAHPGLGGVLLPPSAMTKAGFKVVERRLYALPQPAEGTVSENELESLAWGLDAQVEAGPEGWPGGLVWALATAALVLVLGGTFAATGLAAADMRRDLDTMSAVGAPPVTRRLVIAAQAGYISGLGAVVGLVAGVVTGVALASWRPEDRGLVMVLDIPWSLLAGTVVGLPLLAALIVGLLTRTRPTLTRRLA